MAVTCYVWRVRNELRVCEGTTKNDNRYWYIDINDGSIHGFSGRRVNKVPSGYFRAVTNAGWYGDNRYERRSDDYLVTLFIDAFLDGDNYYGRRYSIKTLRMIERICNATNRLLTPCDRYYYPSDYALNDTLETLNDNKKTFKKFIKFFQEQHDFESAEFSLGLIYQMVRNYQDSVALAGYQTYIDKYDIDTVRYLVNSVNSLPESEKCAKLILKWYDSDVVQMLLKLDWQSQRSITDHLTDIIKYCQAMEREFPKKITLEDIYIIHRDWHNMRDEIKTRTLQAHQKQEWADVEDSEFLVIVPTTFQELIKEGQAMNNCVAGIWATSYDNNLMEGKQSRGLLFIRRKSEPNKPYIDCDFDLDSGAIRQYYTKNNYSVSVDSPARTFKNKLQEHLYACCDAS